MGIKKIGDRVRMFVAIKQLRTKAVGNQKRRTRDSIAALDNRSIPYTPSSTSSPRNNIARERLPTPSTGNTTSNRYSRQIDPTAYENFRAAETRPRPSSPLAEPEQRGLRAQRYGGMSPVDGMRKDQSQGYFSHPSSAKTASGRRPGTPSRQNMMPDSTVGRLPSSSPVIRIIWNSGQSKVLDIKNCNTAEEISVNVLRKLGLQERHYKSYCFYTLEPSEPNVTICRRLSDNELVRVCKDQEGNDRNRLILRKIHEGPPEAEDLRKATAIYHEENSDTHFPSIPSSGTGSRAKAAQRLGETWETIENPSSPGTNQYSRNNTIQSTDRNRSNSNNVNQGWDPPEQPGVVRRPPKPKIKEFLGGRPPSELISQELTTYFPGHQKKDIENTVRMSMRRSARLSRAQSRISVASNISFTSNLQDAPPLPNIAHAWLGEKGQTRAPRPLSVSKFALPQMTYRDSIASSSLQPLAEESPLEPNRKSYVSFDSDPPFNNNDPGDSGGASSALQSYFDESGSSGPTTEASGSFNDQLSHAIADDGEDPDPELDSFLKGESWDNVKWMQGALIGQGSFGSVYLALHAVTGELMAVKQVEVPSNSNGPLDKKKSTMVAALKREIDLLRDLQHENIVQYLGSNSDENHFNIFLEYVPGGSVAAMLNSYGQLHEPLIRNFVRQILAGLSYLHGRDIIHRDIKGANVLVDNKGNIKISDFGISKRVQASALLQPGAQPHRSSLQGSVFWMAPEVVKQKPHSRKADIWSLGCLIVEMYTGTHPYPECSQLQAIFQIGGSQCRPQPPPGASPEGLAFLDKTFEVDQDKRPSADELLVDPFLKQIA